MQIGPLWFVHPWALGFGAAAVALPVLIHLLARPRRRRMALPTVRFLRQSLDAHERRSRPRDRLLLALRMLAIALLAAGFARPSIGSDRSARSEDGSPLTRVVILDVSQSMSAVGSDGSTAFDRAQSIARDFLKFEPSMRADLILAGGSASACFDASTINLPALRTAVDAAKPLPERAHAPAAIDLAGRLLVASPQTARCELIIVSDFQRSDWSTVDLSGLPAGTQVDTRPVADGPPASNLAMTAVTPHGPLDAGQPISIDCTVANHSPAARAVTIELTLADRSTRHSIDVPAGQSVIATLTVPGPDAGWWTGHVRIVDAHDALPADDERPFACRVFAPPTIAIITREPPTPSPTSSHFVERALAPAGEETIVRMSADALDAEGLARASMIVLDHPGRLDGPAVARIARRVMQDGLGMLYVSAEPVDADNLEAIARAAENAWQSPVDFSARSEQWSDRPRRVITWNADAPGLSLMTDVAASVLAPLEWRGGLRTQPRAGGLADDVAMTYDDGSAALVISACGAGSVAILNADLSRSNVVAAPLFVPLLDEVAARLMPERHRPIDPIPGGLPIAMPLDAAVSSTDSLTVETPRLAGSVASSFSVTDGRVWLRTPALVESGVYQVRDGGRTVHALAIAAPRDESDLDSIDPATWSNRVPSGLVLRTNSAGNTNTQASDRGWTWLMLLALVATLTELFIARLGRHGGRPT